MCRTINGWTTAIEADLSTVLWIDVLAPVGKGVVELDFHFKAGMMALSFCVAGLTCGLADR